MKKTNKLNIQQMIVQVAIATKYSIKKLRLVSLFISLTLALGCSQTGNNGMTNKNNSLSPNSCLDDLRTNELVKSINSCTEVIKMYPDRPQPLNDRSLLYILIGDMDLACQDIRKGIDLLTKEKTTADPLLKYELNVRHANCMQLRNILDKD